MRFDIITIFPEFFHGPLDWGIVRRARDSKLIEISVHDLRDFTHDRHRTVDDRPFGGGEGMVLKPEPIFEAVESLSSPLTETPPRGTAIVLLSASGKLFRQETARRFSALERVILICGRYEGVDERVAERLASEEISVGDFVLSGGELPAAIVLDAVTRLLPGALGNEDSAMNESFSVDEGERGDAGPGPATATVSRRGTLDFPHYTRPQNFRGWEVPEILMSGNHEEIRRWRRRMAIEKTLRNRPDLLCVSSLSPADRKLLAEAKQARSMNADH
ncbi:MAG TPA: tRNA (guanosine(37)-N1)-methyltransferase TrmD [Candidatus Acidoferrum sp.]|nr:tRNA (guanosine(37)-N1)-methyltransferase TrmD [Candidatus Acidoferrum sp.]HEV2488700.1 tRNA (guanosine(37)-N1)-methyltransferase TrmD [Candidatus Acidoferrales bacterium]